jgi:uncharacterized membrane protein YozB (DUF420 family)
MQLWENWAGAAVCVLIGIGLAYRRTPSRHIPVMLGAFAADLALLLYIEFGKSAIKQAVSGALPTIRYVHIAIAVLTLLLYFAQVYTGFRLWRKGKGRATHKRLAVIFLPARLATTVTSFMATAATPG